jgi:pyruvate dehydrogenase E2 component (dihydrolipoamide acetyltransferase)
MAEKMVMLALSPTMEKGKIVSWKKHEGDQITSGEAVCEVETDKAVMDYTSMQEGTLLKIVVPEGGEAKVEETIAILGQEGESLPEMAASPAQPIPESEKPASPEAKSAPKEVPQEAPKKEPTGKAPSSPMARTIAQEQGIDISSIQGSGPEGRVVKADVEKAVHEGKCPLKRKMPPELKDETVDVSMMRATIAKRMSESKSNAPHYYLKASVRMDTLIEARHFYNEHTQDAKLSLNAFLIKITAEAIKHHPVINSTWQGDKIAHHGQVDIALAVALPEGLTAPIIRNCTAKGIIAIDAEVEAMVEKARSNRLTPEDYQNSTFTISNIGSTGIEEFTAIINPPGSAILAVGTIMRKPVVNVKDELEIHSVSVLTLSCDHRVIDGAVGAAFLHDLKNMIEHPIHALF